MFIGHDGIGFAGKAFAPKASLGTWLMAVNFLDLVWPILLLTGAEHVKIEPGITKLNPLNFTDYPITHSLVGALAWSIGFALIYGLSRKDFQTACLLGFGVFSHWILDWIVHRPDLPLMPGNDEKFGLGIWNIPALALAIEALIYVGGFWMYFRCTRSKDKVGNWSVWSLFVLLPILFVSSLPKPPPNEQVIAWMGLTGWLIPIWGYWIERHQESTTREAITPGSS